MSDAADKVVEASPDKKARAKKKGDVESSQELVTAAALLGLLLGLFASVPFAQSLASELKILLLRPEGAGAAVLFEGLGWRFIRAGLFFVLPLAVFPAAATLIALAVQDAIVFAPQRIAPKLDKVSPIKGAGKKFGPQALLEFVKSMVKVVALSSVGVTALVFEAGRISRAFAAPPIALPQLLLRELLVMLAIGVAITGAAALIDLPLVRAQREKRLKMSRQEAADEQKEQEGDAGLKAQRRKRAEAIALHQMMQEIKTADVVMTNPTHYAVALKWDRTGGELPRCVAKGVDEIALRLRSAAFDAGVPIKEDPPAARALYASVEMGDPVKPEHFQAVAAAIRFADRMRALRRKG
ncbi:EscU/YscU/HrcU family type III secretion system export apparatus switch protein [Parvularcula maris]|uniref:EscU/YscU/HrcU family type III secretion system export apparatus switch protein n=1 Tax=Parvularcula maris TaxID=2965077 RepID=A0A9X2L8K3_9PROT|nr:EscU/YscU/HrcU family type III secretion system export apparatus switch protein [Parvularcula maris]